jgi:hypothetical protein
VPSFVVQTIQILFLHGWLIHQSLVRFSDRRNEFLRRLVHNNFFGMTTRPNVKKGRDRILNFWCYVSMSRSYLFDQSQKFEKITENVEIIGPLLTAHRWGWLGKKPI